MPGPLSAQEHRQQALLRTVPTALPLMQKRFTGVRSRIGGRLMPWIKRGTGAALTAITIGIKELTVRSISTVWSIGRICLLPSKSVSGVWGFRHVFRDATTFRHRMPYSQISGQIPHRGFVALG